MRSFRKDHLDRTNQDAKTTKAASDKRKTATTATATAKANVNLI
jgi:hypothetical protein